VSDTTLSRDDLEHTISELEAELAEAKLRDGTSHPGYIIGVHWMTAAYGRICAGEDEQQVMSDYGYRRSFAGAIERTAEALARGPYSGEGT
jgi:hypothetical protein